MLKTRHASLLVQDRGAFCCDEMKGSALRHGSSIAARVLPTAFLPFHALCCVDGPWRVTLVAAVVVQRGRVASDRDVCVLSLLILLYLFETPFPYTSAAGPLITQRSVKGRVAYSARASASFQLPPYNYLLAKYPALHVAYVSRVRDVRWGH